MLKKSLLALIATSLLVACGSKDKATIEFEIENGERIAFLMADTANTITIDTLELPSSGKLTYSLSISEPNFYVLDFMKGKSLPMYIEPGDHIKVKVDVLGDILGDRVSGTLGSDILHNINAEMGKSIAFVDSLEEMLMAVYEQDEDEAMMLRMELDRVYQQRVEDHREALRKILEENQGNLATIFVFYQRLGNMPFFNPYEDIKPFIKAQEAILAKNPNNMHAVFFANRNKRFIEALEQEEKRKAATANIAPGNPAPEIALANDNGEVIKLSSLKGKVVLVDFWAAWCGPCRQANPRVVKVYNQYKDKGFTVYSVSLDGLPNQPAPREEWQQAIKDDKLDWPNHVSELTGWNSSLVPVYGFEGIPFTLLLDKEGVIIKVNPQPEELPALIEQYL